MSRSSSMYVLLLQPYIGISYTANLCLLHRQLPPLPPLPTTL